MTLSASAQLFAPGAHIEIRDEVWRVVSVDMTSTGGKALHVVGLSEFVRDKSAIFLTEYERDVRVLRPEETRIVPDTSNGYARSMLYIESMLRRIAPTDDRLHVGHRAAMDVMEYQLRPAAKALSQPRQRILIADAVGLGKTLEAGILLSELIARGRGRRILVVGVKSMLTQLQKEFWSRFGIGLVRLDSIGLQRIRSHIPTHHNPFHHFDRAIISIDTLKQNNAFSTYLEQARWDVIVIDEAHNVAHRGKGRHKRSMRARLADLLATRSDALIMLSATPHDGRARSFASLMNMLDPTAIANEEAYQPQEVEHLFVRRFKKDVVMELSKNFPERTIEKIKAAASPLEEAAFECFTALTFKSLDQSSGQHLFKTALEKALLSSPAACAQTVTNRVRRLEGDIKKHRAALQDAQEGRAKPEDASPEKLAALRDRLQGKLADVAALEDFKAKLALIGVEDFAKYRLLLEVIRKRFKWKASKKDDRLVIFTERIETLKFLAEHLSADLKLKWSGYPRKGGEGSQNPLKDQLLVLDGSMSDVQQQQVVEAFGRDKAKVRVLVASDVASEGINLHYLSHRMVHFDIPWSLMVFQQRNGRVDRYGQLHQPQIVYLLTTSGVPRINDDNRVLEILIEKDEQVQENIGDPCAFGGHTVEEQEARTAQAMAEGDAENFMANLLPDAFFQVDEDGELDEDDLLGSLLDGLLDESVAVGKVDAGEQASLFDSDYDYLKTALAQMRLDRRQRGSRGDGQGLEFKCDDDERRVELVLSEDLRRRLTRAVERAVIPDDNRLLLSADPKRIQEDIARTRGEESAWPALHYLWPLHPVMGWVADHMSGALGRHSAPLILLDEGLAVDESVLIMSALVPNRRSQPVLHQWYALRFRGGVLSQVQDFHDFQAKLGLGKTPLVSRDHLPERLAADAEALKPLIALAVEATRDRMNERRERFVVTLNQRLEAQRQNLRALRDRKLEALGKRELVADRHAREEARIRQVFDDYNAWVRDTMTTEPVPFIQVIAALKPSFERRQ